MSNPVSLTGLNKPAVFAALFNGSKPQGLGFLHYNPEPMTAEKAAERFGDCAKYFDYVDGRVMKVDLTGDELRTGLYNRDNGENSAEKIIHLLQETGDSNPEEVELLHKENTRNSAMFAKENILEESLSVDTGDIFKHTLGLADVADVLEPKLDDVIGDSE